MSMVIGLGRLGIYNQKFPSIKSPDPLITRSCKVTKYCICCITNTTRPMATKRGKVVTYYKKLQPIKSHNPFYFVLT